MIKYSATSEAGSVSEMIEKTKEKMLRPRIAQ
jgi:hypothetical protein